MIITKQIEIDMGHRVPNHKSKCFHLHGHRYRIEVAVEGEVIKTEGSSDEGMIIDYGDLKDILMSEIHDKFDHKFLRYYEDQFFAVDNATKIVFGVIDVGFIPTAENLAKHWYELLESKLKQRAIAIRYVKVWETPNSTATYGK